MVRSEAEKTILCVDDEKNVLASLRRVLRPLRYNLVEVMNGEEALAMVERYHPDLIILDARMPVMNGYEFMSRLTDLEAAESPVIMLTADRTDEGLLRGYREGAVYYITKPFRSDYLRDAVRFFIEDLAADEKREIELRMAGGEIVG